MLATVTVVPGLVCPTVTLPNAIGAGVAVTFGVGAAEPVPDSATEIGVPPAKLTVSVPLSAAAAAGAYATLTVHDAPAASVEPHVFPESGNFTASLLATPRPVALAPPVLEIVTAFAAAVVPTVMLPNASEPGAAWTFGVAGAVPVPDMKTVTAEPPV